MRLAIDAHRITTPALNNLRIPVPVHVVNVDVRINMPIIAIS